MELVSVKHREQDQRAWTFGDLTSEHVFRDLHGVWKETGEDGDYIFESSRGISRALRDTVASAADTAAETAGRLAGVLGVCRAEAARFAKRLILPQEPVPDRRIIREVSTARLAAVMPQLGLEPGAALACVMAMEARVADIAVDRPPEPAQRVQALAGLMRAVKNQAGPDVASFLLTIEELREIVIATATGRHAPARARPPADDPLFTGRVAELARLAELLTPRPDGMITPVVLTGMPGIGKTALAARFATVGSMRARLIPADTRTALLAGLHQLNPSEQSAASAGAGSASQVGRPAEPAIPDDPGLLLILDGLTDPDVTAGLVPRESRTTILITATCPHVDDGFRHLPVGGLSPADAAIYLRRVLPAAAEDDLGVLIEAFDGNPLGLAQGANYCLTTGLSAGQYIDRLRRDPARVLDLGHAAGHPLTIAAAIRAAVAEAIQDPAARALASALAWLAPGQVPEWIFVGAPMLVHRKDEDDPDHGHPAQGAAQDIAALADPLALDAAVAVLARHGLVRRGPGGLRMHALVQDITRALGDHPARRTQYDAVVGLLLTAMTSEEVRPSANTLTPHVAAAAAASDVVGGDPLITSYLMTWLGNQHYDYGDLPTARSYLDQAVALARQPNGPHEVLPAILHDLVKALRAAGDVDAALAAADVWAAAAKSAGEDLDEYRAKVARISTLAYAGRFPQAEAELAVLNNDPKPAGMPVSNTIIELSVLAEIHRGGGNSQGALDAVTQATQLARDHTTGLILADHLAALSNQASQLEGDLGREAEALERQREAVNAARELGLRIPLARQLHGLASRLIDCGQTGEAAEVINEGIRLTGGDSPTSLLRGDFLQARGRLALANEDPGAARQLLSEAIPLFEASGEPHQPGLAAAWFNLATAQATLGELEIAAESYQKARDIEARVYGKDHPELIADEFHLAFARYATSNIDAAHEAISRCLTVIRKGGHQAHIWRDRALTLAIMIDVEQR
jgi:tetratricopeptide (TPR) repeat protein